MILVQPDAFVQIFQVCTCSIRRNYCKYFRGVADLIHHRLHFVLFRVFLYQDLVFARRNSHPWCIFMPGPGFFDHFIVQGFVFSEHVWTFIHPWWSLRVNAERSCDLKGGGGDREAWLPVIFDTDIAASWFPVHANQTCPFAHAHFMFWSSVSSEPSSQ